MARVLGQIVAGSFEKILVRQKAGASLELGDLVIVKSQGIKILCQVYDLIYGSQLSQQHIELMSGMKLEENSVLELFDEPLRNYNLAVLKALITIKGDKAALTKVLPPFFSQVEEVSIEDFNFLSKPKHSLKLGFLRSGSKKLPIEIFIDSELSFSHHILIPAQTGKGKSNLTKCLLWNNMESPRAGILVFDPHDEYFGRSGLGLKDHPEKKNMSYYTPRNVPPGAKTLRINVRSIKPNHLLGVYPWTDAQSEALSLAYKEFGKEWLIQLMLIDTLKNFHEATLSVLKRRISWLLNAEAKNGRIIWEGAFDSDTGEGTCDSIIDELEKGKVVIIDTSSFASNTETLIGTILATEALSRYQHYKGSGELDSKPVISIVLEEAARVLGKESLERGPNIFSTLAREGRKFKVGLVAITQLPSMIPREILANLSTKIILGIEMAQERQAIIESAAQDLSTDERTIASLDKGEALVTSNFTKFAIPISIPLFLDIALRKQEKEKISIPELG